MPPPSGSAVATAPEGAKRLEDPALRTTLIRLVRRNVPEREVEDIVQDTLADALATPSPPADARALRNWASGIARNKVVDFHRRSSREDLVATAEPGAHTPEPHGAFDLRRWAEGRLPPTGSAKRAFQWMLEEGEGEKLEQIALRERLPAATVRQQVARLRRHLRLRWAAEIAVLVAAGVLVAVFFVGRSAPREPVARDGARHEGVVAPSPSVRAGHERQVAFDRAAAEDWRGCLDALDRAASLDPEGDANEPVVTLRAKALEALARPTPTPAPSAAQGAPRRRPGYDRLPGDTAPAAPNPCVCPRGDPLCSCLAP